MGENASGVDDDVGQIVDVVVGQRLALGGRQFPPVLGRREGVVDRVVRDARLVGIETGTAM